MRDLDPGQDEKAGGVGDEADVFSARLTRPGVQPVARAGLGQ